MATTGCLRRSIRAGSVVRWFWLLAASLLLACAEDPSPQPITLRLALPAQPSSGLAMVALAQGYFREQGLRVVVEKFPSGKRALRESFLKGDSDVVLCSDVPLVSAVMASASAPAFRVVASSFVAHNLNRVIARRDAGIVSPADLRGKRVATQKGSAVHYFLHLFLLDNDLSEAEVQLVFLKAEQLPAALMRGDIDAFSMREPFIGEAARLLGDNHVSFSSPGLYNQFDAVLVAEDYLRKQPEATERFLRALSQAEAFVLQNRQQAIGIVADYIGAAEATLERQWSDLIYRLSLEQMLLVSMEGLGRWLMEAEIVEAQAVPNSLEFIDTRPLSAVNSRAVTLYQ